MKIKNYFKTANLLFLVLALQLLLQIFIEMNCIIFFSCLVICVINRKHRIKSCILILIVYGFIVLRLLLKKPTDIDDIKDAADDIKGASYNIEDASDTIKNPNTLPENIQFSEPHKEQEESLSKAKKPVEVKGVYAMTTVEIKMRTKDVVKGNILLDGEEVATFEKSQVPIVN
ncbi:hypothetical protein NGRA_1000 [Nosema granulosis]|uniref:Uncharacterized protein n=1 Tax=Nosema granulosis TaxID=83296 RepID=A0A9P6GZ90_9MICR|nr:hypothetical protein NGRA_1000 [Nosema granulosis]